VFPLSTSRQLLADLEEQAVRILSHAYNLRILIWTRKGTLSDAIFDAISALPCLEELEINAKTDNWSGTKLCELQQLRGISLLMPDWIVLRTLPDALENQLALSASSSSEPSYFRHLSLICLESTIVTDWVVLSISPYISSLGLVSLTLVGCPKVSDASLLSLLRETPTIQHLALESVGISPVFFSHAAPYLANLRTLKVTHPGERHAQSNEFYPSLAELAGACPKFEGFIHVRRYIYIAFFSLYSQAFGTFCSHA
jgi:hypothetical protein